MIALLLANFISAPKYSICFSYSLRTEGHVRLISVTYLKKNIQTAGPPVEAANE